MAELIPFTPGVPHGRLEVALDGVTYLIDHRWNSRDKAHYLDFFEADETPIVRGVKVVLGVFLAQRSTHPLFVGQGLFAYDTSGESLEAGIDDLGARVTVSYFTAADLTLATAP